MGRIRLEVRWHPWGEEGRQVVEVPNDHPVRQVAPAIAQELREREQREGRFLPPPPDPAVAFFFLIDLAGKRILDDGQTLAAQGITEGAILQLHIEPIAHHAAPRPNWRERAQARALRRYVDMSHLRRTRLTRDWQTMQDLATRTEKIRFGPHGDPPYRYDLTYLCKGLLDHGGAPVEATEFHFTVELGPDYPEAAPSIIVHTPVFHPDFRGATVYYASRRWWQLAEEGLAALVLDLGSMIQYHRYNLVGPLNRQAADWARENTARFPIDPDPL